ncbi:hypothetical protein ASE63_23255 [Bosea sp. Root381]|nr:hypothetical protein ASE63_23255 [Bosea sp. Root381]
MSGEQRGRNISIAFRASIKDPDLVTLMPGKVVHAPGLRVDPSTLVDVDKESLSVIPPNQR